MNLKILLNLKNLFQVILKVDQVGCGDFKNLNKVFFYGIQVNFNLSYLDDF